MKNEEERKKRKLKILLLLLLLLLFLLYYYKANSEKDKTDRETQIAKEEASCELKEVNVIKPLLLNDFVNKNIEVNDINCYEANNLSPAIIKMKDFLDSNNQRIVTNCLISLDNENMPENKIFVDPTRFFKSKSSGNEGRNSIAEKIILHSVPNSSNKIDNDFNKLQQIDTLKNENQKTKSLSKKELLLASFAEINNVNDFLEQKYRFCRKFKEFGFDINLIMPKILNKIENDDASSLELLQVQREFISFKRLLIKEMENPSGFKANERPSTQIKFNPMALGRLISNKDNSECAVKAVENVQYVYNHVFNTRR